MMIWFRDFDASTWCFAMYSFTFVAVSFSNAVSSRPGDAASAPEEEHTLPIV